MRSALARFTIIGDGPERDRLEELTRSLGLDKEVSFCGWLSHDETMQRLQSADIMVFPSIRDNSPAVVFEALASGAVPVVVDFGGPGDTVRPGVGYKVRLTNEADVVSQIQEVLANCAQDRDLLERMRNRAVSYARETLSWDAKAEGIHIDHALGFTARSEAESPLAKDVGPRDCEFIYGDSPVIAGSANEAKMARPNTLSPTGMKCETE